MTPEQLRASILQYAVEGKLVKQDPTDEPASELLKKIENEKEQLIEAGKIKKGKKLLPISDDEKPFDIPDSWEWVRLGEIINLISGRDIPKKDHLNQKIEGSIPYITGASNIDDNGNINISEWIYKPTVVVNKGTLLLSVKGTIGKISILKLPQAHIARQIMGLDNIFGVDKDYQRYYIESYVQQLQQKAQSIIPGISRDDLLLAIFPLPPLEEQKRIVAKIEKLMPLVDEYAESYSKLQKIDDSFDEKLKKSILQFAMEGKLVPQDPNDEPASELLKKIENEKEQLIEAGKIKRGKKLPPISDDEKNFDIPDSWEWVRIGSIGDVQTGNTPTKKDSTLYNGNLPFIKPANISNKKINYETEEKLSSAGEKKGRVVNKDAILITCIGNLGRNFYVERKVAFNQQINSISPFFVTSELLHYFLESNFFVSTMYRDASATTLPILNKTKLSNLILPLPPLNEQKRIVAKIEKLMSLVDEYAELYNKLTQKH